VARPRGLDRGELDARIRSRRVDQPYRRGGYPDEWEAGAAPGYQPFAPEPEDELAQRHDADGAPSPVVDNFTERSEPGPEEWPHEEDLPPATPASAAPPAESADPWRRGREVPDEPPRERESLVPPIGATPVAPIVEPAPTVEPAPVAARVDPWASRPVEPPPAVEDPEYGMNDEEGWPADEPYYVPADDGAGERRGGSALPIIGFVALGVIALLLGVFFSNLFGDDQQVARTTPSPTATHTVAATPSASETPAASSSAAPSVSGQPNASEGPPITFPDGFVARTEPCVSQPNSNGCNADGATNSGEIWVFIDFESGRRDDVIGMTIVDDAGGVVAQASIELSELGGGGCPANAPCNGWLLFPGFGTPYSGLEPGDYRIRINRNGLPAAEADFTVTG
jgi:hypothetical protein